ncbi:MAG: LamG domain-containing protein, partial [Deltaproteobacteria bacterium]|nr:LamG domain-containing protein [Deltaproteobacteria bacterium]
SAAITISNTAPVLASVSLSTAAPTENDTLSATLGATSDDDGDTVTVSYEWFVNGTSAGTGTTLSSSSFAKGDTITLVVTPWDGTSWGSPVTSDVATAVNTPPAVSSVTLSPEDAYTDDVLTASASATDLDGDSLSYTYDWYVDGLLAQSGASATLDGATAFSRDEEVHVVVTPNDGDTDGTSATSSALTVANSAPTAPEVEITPEDAEEGDDLTCTVVTESTDADGDAVTYSFAWDVDGVDYTGATDSAAESVVDGADVGSGQTWTCEVVAGDGDATSSVASSSLTTEAACGDGLYASFEDDTNCPIAHWDMSTMSGTRVADLIGDNDLTVTGSPLAGVDGVVGATYSIASSSQYFTSIDAYPSRLSGSGSKSISLWAYLDAKGGDGDGISVFASFGGKNSDGTSFCACYDNEVGDDEPSLGAGGAAYDLQGTTPWGLGRWYHYAITYDGVTSSIYVDGVLESSRAVTLRTGTTYDKYAVAVHTLYGASTHYLASGRVDEVKVYDYALSPSQVSELSSLTD